MICWNEFYTVYDKEVSRNKKKIDRLSKSLNQCLELMAKIRYRNWPTGGIGVSAEDMDEVMYEAELALKYKPR
jgi:hypothetical protein